MDPFFIDTYDLKTVGLINYNVEDSILRVIIQRVQRAVVRPIIGCNLYDRLTAGITANDLNADELVLMNKYIIPLMACACDRKAINATTYEIRSKTTGTARDEHMQPVTESENNKFDADLRQDITVAKNDLIQYLCKNASLYPDYDHCSCSCSPTRSTKGIGLNFRIA